MWYFLSNLSSLMSQKERILFERKVIGYYSVGAVEIVRIYQGTNAYRDKFHSCWGTQIICVLSWSLLSLKWFDSMPKKLVHVSKVSFITRSILYGSKPYNTKFLQSHHSSTKSCNSKALEATQTFAL